MTLNEELEEEKRQRLAARRPGWEKRWRQSFVKERLAACEVAARFLADRYGNPGEDLIDLIYCREWECFTTRDHTHLSDVKLNEEIEEWMEANPSSPPLLTGWSAYNMLESLCGHWMDGCCKQPKPEPKKMWRSDGGVNV
jgi:hypothetical protein